MDFVFFGYDQMHGVAARLIAAGHKLRAVFTFPCDNVFNFNQGLYELAGKQHAPITELAPKMPDIESLIHAGVKVFLCAGYPFKIPAIDERHAYGLNLHPSLLPQGRGLMPVPHILLDHPKAAGFSVHKLTARFDAGDILAQVPFSLSPRETVETYSARIALAAPDLIAKIMADLPDYWRRAKAQDERKASYFPPPDEGLRTLDWCGPIASIEAKARAFGRYGCLAPVEGQKLAVYHLDTWPEKHAFTPGTLVIRQMREIIIAARDGFVCLKDFSL